jgi:hypothetical protein
VVTQPQLCVEQVGVCGKQTMDAPVLDAERELPPRSLQEMDRREPWLRALAPDDAERVRHPGPRLEGNGATGVAPASSPAPLSVPTRAKGSLFASRPTSIMSM